MQNNGDLLLKEQRKYLPLKLSLKTVKERYAVNENIEFVVILENVSSNNLRIKDLDKDTLYFLYADMKWGAVESESKKGKKEFLLKPGEKIQKTFIGRGFSFPREFEIYCSYALTYKGVKPSNVLKVHVTGN